MTDADHLIRAAAWLRAFPHLPTMREGVKHEHAVWAETLERLAARLPRMVEIAPEDAALGPWVVSGGWTPKHAAAAERIERALEKHGKVQR